MIVSLGSVRKALFGLSLTEASFQKRGFALDGDAQAREFLQESARTFIRGYNLALEKGRLDDLIEALEMIEDQRRGFAYEGAAMALNLLDCVFPWKQRLLPFLNGPGNKHFYMIHVGAGWVLARLPQSPGRLLAKLDPLVNWLAIDGYGFHDGFFSWRKTLQEPYYRPRRLRGYAARAYDQGLGRSLWFAMGANIERIASTIRGFPEERRGDVWSGIGLACAYAGGIDQSLVRKLFAETASYRSQFAQGVGFAAEARHRARNNTAHMDAVCQIVWQCSSEEVAGIVAASLRELAGKEKEYEDWRVRIRQKFEAIQVEQATKTP